MSFTVDIFVISGQRKLVASCSYDFHREIADSIFESLSCKYLVVAVRNDTSYYNPPCYERNPTC